MSWNFAVSVVSIAQTSYICVSTTTYKVFDGECVCTSCLYWLYWVCLIHGYVLRVTHVLTFCDRF